MAQTPTPQRFPVFDYLDGTRAPLVTDDADSGFQVGSRWLDVNGERCYVCVDTTPGAASWKDMTAGAGAVEWTDVLNKPAAFPPSSHAHAVADVTSLQAALDGKSALGHGHAIADVANLQGSLDGKVDDAELSNHLAAGDPHPGYALDSELGLYVPKSLVDAAGDLLVGSGADELARLAAAGATGDVLTRDDAEALKMKWAAPAGGGFAWEAVVKQGADVTHAAASFVNTDLVFNFVANGVYAIDLFLLCTSAATGTGYRFAFDVSVAVTTVGLQFTHALANTGTMSGGRSIADDTATGLSSGVPTAGALNFIPGMGLLVAGGSSGTCRLRFGPEVAASATFKANSVMRVHRVA